MSLKKNLLKNGIATGLQKGVNILEQLLLVPFFITAWGVNFYGEWLTLTVIPTMFAYTNLGFGSAAAGQLVLRYAAAEYQKAANISRTGFLLISLTLLTGVLFGGVLLFILDSFGVFAKSLIPKQDAITAVSLIMLARGFDFYQQLSESYFIAARKASLSINLLSGYSLLKLISGLTVLVLGGGIILFALVNLCASLCFNIIYSILGSKVLALKNLAHGKVLKSDFKLIARKGFGYLLSPVWQSIYFQGTTFVVRITLGAGAVVIFNTLRTVSRTANQTYSMINSTIFPELQYEIGAGRMEKARQIYRSALGVSLMLAILGILMLWLFGERFYMIWTRHSIHPPTAVWNVFLIGIGFNALWWTSAVVFRAVNRPYGLTVVGSISAIISVGSSYILAKEFGLVGAAIGSLFLDVIMSLFILPMSCKLIGQTLYTLPSDIIRDLSNFRSHISKMRINRLKEK